MGRRTRDVVKGRRTHGPFLALPRKVLDSSQWARLGAAEVKLLLDVAAAYRGSNNGDLSCTWKGMQKRGWRSRDTLGKALCGLLDSGFLIQTRQGGRNRCSLYAIAWEGIDECGGKHDMRPTPVPPNCWEKGESGRMVGTSAVSTRHAGRVNGASSHSALTRPACQ